MEKGRVTNPANPGIPVARVPGLNLQTYVMDRLARWAVWCIWREGLLVRDPRPKRANSWWWSMVMLPHMHQSGLVRKFERPCPVDVLEAEETDACVRALMAQDERRGVKYARVIVLCYLTRLSSAEKAAAMDPPGCFKTYYRRLSYAHEELLGLMNDVGAGVPLTGPVAIA